MCRPAQIWREGLTGKMHFISSSIHINMIVTTTSMDLEACTRS